MFGTPPFGKIILYLSQFSSVPKVNSLVNMHIKHPFEG